MAGSSAPNTKAPGVQKGTGKAQGAALKTTKWITALQLGVMGVADCVAQQEVFMSCVSHKLNSSEITCSYMSTVTHGLSTEREEKESSNTAF